jgi:hypothetical protein
MLARQALLPLEPLHQPYVCISNFTTLYNKRRESLHLFFHFTSHTARIRHIWDFAVLGFVPHVT